jgi:hypothetical protein
MEWHMRSRKSYHMECMCPVNYLKCVFACAHPQERERKMKIIALQLIEKSVILYILKNNNENNM